MNVIRIGPDYDHSAILSLIQRAFAEMEGRINPPSSMHKLTASNIKTHSINGDILVLETDGQPVACLFGTPKGKSYYLGRIAIETSYRGQGLARQLINAAENYAKARQASVLELECRIELVENHATFKRLGFMKTGEKRHEGYTKTTSIIMQRQISE